MKIIRKNKLILQETPQNLKKSLKKFLTITNPKWLDAIKYGRYYYNIPRLIKDYEEQKDDIIVPRGIYRPLLSVLSKNNISYEEIDERLSFKSKPINSNIVLRDSQIPIINAIKDREEGVIVAPPGSGKTVLGMYLISKIGQPTIWITHTNKLFNQAIERAVQFLEIEKEDLGIIRQKDLKISKLTVAMLQTLYSIKNLSDIIGNFGMVIIDEVHHLPAQSFLTCITQFPSKYIFGLTATPFRKDGLEGIMFQNIGPVLYRLVHEEAGGEVITPLIVKKFTNIPFEYIDGHFQNLISDIIRDYDRNRIIVEDIKNEVEKGNTCIILSSRVEHCRTLHRLLEELKVPARIAVGKGNTVKANEQAIKDIEDGKCNVLIATYSLLGEGFDCPKLNRLFLTTPIRSKPLYIQSVGRILRQYPGKTDSVVFDYIDRCSLLYSQAFSRERYAILEWDAEIIEDKIDGGLL